MSGKIVYLVTVILLLTGCTNMNDYLPLRDTYSLSTLVDRKVSIGGIVANEPWQHMIGEFPGYDHIAYFDTDTDQIVIYSRKPVPAGIPITVYGKVRQVGGKSKRPGDDTAYKEYHILVDKWKKQ